MGESANNDAIVIPEDPVSITMDDTTETESSIPIQNDNIVPEDEICEINEDDEIIVIRDSRDEVDQAIAQDGIQDIVEIPTSSDNITEELQVTGQKIDMETEPLFLDDEEGIPVPEEVMAKIPETRPDTPKSNKKRKRSSTINKSNKKLKTSAKKTPKSTKKKTTP